MLTVYINSICFLKHSHTLRCLYIILTESFIMYCYKIHKMVKFIIQLIVTEN